MDQKKAMFHQYGGKTACFSLMNTFTYGRVVSVYDGDTMSVIIPVFNKFYKFQVRMMGIDTCEIRSKNAENKQLAYQARNRLFELVTEKSIEDGWTRKHIDKYLDDNVYLVYLHCLDFDKYGRVLARVYKDELQPDYATFANVLITEKLGYVYNGATKASEKEQMDMLTHAA